MQKNDKYTRNGPGGVKRKGGGGGQKQACTGPAQTKLHLLPLNRNARAVYTKCYLLIPCFFDKTHNMKLVEHQTTNLTI